VTDIVIIKSFSQKHHFTTFKFEIKKKDRRDQEHSPVNRIEITVKMHHSWEQIDFWFGLGCGGVGSTYLTPYGFGSEKANLAFMLSVPKYCQISVFTGFQMVGYFH